MPRVQGLVRAVMESEGAVEESRSPAPVTASALLRQSAELSGRDVRSKRPPQLSFLLRLDTVRRLARVVILLGLDFAGVYLAIFTALCLKAAVKTGLDVGGIFHQTKDTVSFAYLVTVLLFARSSLYSDRAIRPGLSRIIASLFQVAGVSLIFAVVNGRTFSSFYLFYGSLLFALIYVASFRYFYERLSGFLLRAAGYRRRTVVVGTGPHIDAVAVALSVGPHSPVDVVGFVSLRPRPDNGLRSLGTLAGIGTVIADHRIDEVIIADSDFPQLEAVELIDQCHQRGVRVRIAPSTMEILIHRAEFVPGQSVPLFELKPPVFEGIDFLVKRTFDLVVATLLLIVLSPLLLISMVAVRLTSRGPILYRSIRPGIGGVAFACMKFRTMHNDADERQADLESLNEQSGALFKIRDDPRLTRVGKYLRRFSLDELPQLLNVLRGEMSLVGPRPLPQRDFEQLEPWHMKRYLVLPGITGLWQVSGRANLGFDDLVRLDFLYLERWSVFLDLTILVKTVPAVFTRRGAY
jgi:exopolysaccharide biosynthesis polyprenyl glycosylphosphotransferase